MATTNLEEALPFENKDQPSQELDRVRRTSNLASESPSDNSEKSILRQRVKLNKLRDKVGIIVIVFLKTLFFLTIILLLVFTLCSAQLNKDCSPTYNSWLQDTQSYTK